MKYQILIATFLTTSFFATALAITNDASNTKDKLAVPEIIACESTGQCEMTKLEVLIQLDQQAEKAISQENPSHANAGTIKKLAVSE